MNRHGKRHIHTALSSIVLAATALIVSASCSRPGRLVWQHRYNSGPDGLGSSIATDGNDIVVGGTVRDSSGGTAIALARYDRNGKSKWLRTYPAGKHDSLSGIAVGAGHDIVAMGCRTLNTAGDSTRLLLAKYSPDGDLKWNREYALGPGTRASAMSLDSSGRITVCGSAKGDMFFTRFDSVGNVLDRETLDFADDESALDMIEASLIRGWTTGAYTLVVGVREPVPGRTDSLKTHDIVLICLDADRKVVWRRVYDSGGEDLLARVTGAMFYRPITRKKSDSLRTRIPWSPYVFVAVTSKDDSGISTRVLQYDAGGGLLHDTRLKGIPNASCLALVADRSGGVLGVGATGAGGNQRSLGWRYFRESFSEFLPAEDSLGRAGTRVNDIALDAGGNAVLVGTSNQGGRAGILLTKYAPPLYKPPPDFWLPFLGK